MEKRLKRQPPSSFVEFMLQVSEVDGEVENTLTLKPEIHICVSRGSNDNNNLAAIIMLCAVL